MIISLKPDNPDFMLTHDDFTVHRAEIEVSRDCPEEYRKIIFECYTRGWLTPIAYVLDRDLVWYKLHE